MASKGSQIGRLRRQAALDHLALVGKPCRTTEVAAFLTKIGLCPPEAIRAYWRQVDKHDKAHQANCSRGEDRVWAATVHLVANELFKMACGHCLPRVNRVSPGVYEAPLARQCYKESVS